MSAPTEIRTERLLPRPFKLADGSDARACARGEEWGQFLRLRSSYEYADAERYVAQRLLWSWEALT